LAQASKPADADNERALVLVAQARAQHVASHPEKAH
jgi:hypothetical protein